jgi:hypothetical protein
MSVPSTAPRAPLAALAAVALLALSACSGAGPGPGPSPDSGGSSAARGTTPSASPMESPGAAIPSAMPVAPSSAGTDGAAASLTAIAALTVFYVALDDGGVSGPAIGCGDSVVPTTTGPVEFTDQIAAAIEHLLADRERFLGESGLMNALHRSDLAYVSSSIEGDTVTVLLTGQPVSGGTCDDPRIQEQLRHTAMTAAGTVRAEILVDGTPIEEVMSQK